MRGRIFASHSQYAQCFTSSLDDLLVPIRGWSPVRNVNFVARNVQELAQCVRDNWTNPKETLEMIRDRYT